MREEIDYIAVDEQVEVYLEDTGPLEARVIAVLHGGPGGSSYALREGFGEELQDYRTLYLDQRGSGRSPELPTNPKLFTLDALASDLEHLRDHLEIPNWTLLGHGFGGLVALEYARRFPQHTQLILVNPWVRFPWLAAQMYRASLALRGMEGEAEIPMDGSTLLSEIFGQVEPKAVFDYLMFPSEQSRMEYEWVAEGSTVVGADQPGQMFVYNGLWRLDYTDMLPEVSVPTSVILGTLDGTSYPEAQTIPDLTAGTLELIEGAGHYPWVDQPSAFSTALEEALNKIG
jgi:proline iminopeptidase